MKIYYIHTFATEDRPEEIVSYLYPEFKNIISGLKASGRKFTTWVEEI